VLAVLLLIHPFLQHIGTVCQISGQMQQITGKIVLHCCRVLAVLPLIHASIIVLSSFLPFVMSLLLLLIPFVHFRIIAIIPLIHCNGTNDVLLNFFLAGGGV